MNRLTPSPAVSLPQRLAALLLAGALAALSPPAPAAPKARKPAAARDASASYADRPELHALADAIAARRALDPDWVRATLAQARRLDGVLQLIQPPPAGSAKNWAAYRARFVEPRRIRAGLAFWDAHAAWLAEAEQRFGVPAAIVVGIVGVETLYGRHMGSHRVLDALATLALDYPADARRDRSAFFRDELEQLLLLCRQQELDPLQLRGSYAGALGMPQFMPSSWLRHAVDFDGDGRTDLLGSAADVIGSVANYLAVYGWQSGLATHHAVAPPVDVSERATLLAPDILPSFSAEQFAEHGAELDAGGRAHAGPLALVELQNGAAAPSYVAGTQNFYAITRYNQSSYYALAVIELGEAVAAARGAAR